MARWFRFYDDALNDPKVQCLPPDLFRVWVNLLCVASKNDGALPDAAALAFLLRLSASEAQKAIDALTGAGLLDATENGFEPHNWSERQFKSDVSTERSKQHRQRKRNVAPEPDCNVAATPSETEQNQIQNRSEDNSPRESLPSKTDEWPAMPEFMRADLRPNFQYVAGGAKKFIGIGERERGHKPPAKADQSMVTHLTSHCGMDAGQAWALVMAARDPGSEDHTDAARTCERESRKHKLGWFEEESAA